MLALRSWSDNPYTTDGGFVVGGGMIAQAFQRSVCGHGPALIFASGVSNSNCLDASEFYRERNLLTRCLAQVGREMPFVYFGSCAVYDPSSLSSPYVLHKLAMEDLVLSTPMGIVARLPQVIGPAPLSSNTLVPFLVRMILARERIQVWEYATRNVIDVDHVVLMLNEYLSEFKSFPRIFNIISSSSITVPALVQSVELALGRRAIKEYVKRGSAYNMDASVSDFLSKRLNIIFDADYCVRSIRNHYSQYCAPGASAC